MRFALACLFLLLPLPAHAERLALVIGNADFQKSQDLPQTAADATAIAAKLDQLGFRLIGSKAHVNLTRAEMLQQIRALGSDASEGDDVVFYFSGHGIGGVQTNYLLPVDDQYIETKEDVPDLAVDVATILDRLPKGGDGVNVFILDACRDNPLPSRAKSAFGEKGLVRVSRGATNTVFLYAAEPGEKAYVSAAGRSFFTDALLGALDTPGEELTDMMRRVRLRVQAETQDTSARQLPWIEGLTAKPFFFSLDNKPAPAASASLLANDEGTALAQAISTNTLGAYTAFRDRFPSSTNLSFVNAKIAELAPRTGASEPLRKAGEEFRDPFNDPFNSADSQGPLMVVLPKGSFTMGSPPGEEGRNKDEAPQRTVLISYQFAVGKYELTWSEYTRCVSEGACPNANDDGFGGENHPVTNVSWDAAKAYAVWLSAKTGQTYRLLSEAEWEYAARAGTTTPYSFGSDPDSGCGYMNGADATTKQAHPSWTTASCNDEFLTTAPVGSFAANAFNLHDMHGNVREWVEDCYEADYRVQPADGRAYATAGCARRVVRSGSWGSGPELLRSASRDRLSPFTRYDKLGFRLARTLPD